jgi:hypothetical protein
MGTLRFALVYFEAGWGPNKPAKLSVHLLLQTSLISFLCKIENESPEREMEMDFGADRSGGRFRSRAQPRGSRRFEPAAVVAAAFAELHWHLVPTAVAGSRHARGVAPA